MIALGSSRGLAQIAAIRRIFARTLATEGRRLDALGWRTLNDARDEARRWAAQKRSASSTSCVAATEAAALRRKLITASRVDSVPFICPPSPWLSLEIGPSTRSAGFSTRPPSARASGGARNGTVGMTISRSDHPCNPNRSLSKRSLNCAPARRPQLAFAALLSAGAGIPQVQPFISHAGNPRTIATSGDGYCLSKPPSY